MAMVDITVRGAGVFGLSIAWACLRRGAGVQVIDPAGPGAGASGGPVGALAPHVPENWNAKKAFQLESLLMAADFWHAVEAASGQSSGYARLGRLQPLADLHGLDLARARAESAAGLWQGRARWAVVPADGAWQPKSPTGWLVHDDLSARLQPRMAISALAAAIIVGGGAIRRQGDDRGALVHATGTAGLAALSLHFGRGLGAGIKGQAALLDHDARDQPQIYAGGVHIVPHADGTTAVGSTSENSYAAPDTTDDRLERVIDAARAAVPALADAQVIGRWAGLRPRAQSRAPVLGSWPGRRGHFIANGGFKIGFGMAPKIAAVMADLLIDAKDTIPDAFRLDRLL